MRQGMRYSVDDSDGNQITTGLQEHEARMVAQQIANDRGESVFLSADTGDDTGAIEIKPTGKGN